MPQIHIPDLRNKEILIVYKISRYAYAVKQSKSTSYSAIDDENDPITKNLKLSHERNLRCIDEVKSIVSKLGIKHQLKCRSDITSGDTKDRFIISVGGDGTLLDVSHHCSDSPMLGVNSDPKNSIGALCAATKDDLALLLDDIYQGKVLPSPIARLQVKKSHEKSYLALNDVLFCHKNPASMSRFFVTLNNHSESHRSSGMWVASPAGSTGAIFSAGAKSIDIDSDYGIFRQREPSWCDQQIPKLLNGKFSKSDKLMIRSNMDEGLVFIDGPHKIVKLALGEMLEISLAKEPLWLFELARLKTNRERIIKNRNVIDKLMSA